MSYYGQPSTSYSRDPYYGTSSRQSYNDFYSPATSTRSIAPRGYPITPSSPYSNYPSAPSSSSYSTSPGSPYSPGFSSYSRQQPTSSQPEMTCLFPNCSYRCVRKADMERHVAVNHIRESVQMTDCQHPGCHRTGSYGFTRKDKMVDHMREVHKCNIPKKSRGGSR